MHRWHTASSGKTKNNRTVSLHELFVLVGAPFLTHVGLRKYVCANMSAQARLLLWCSAGKGVSVSTFIQRPVETIKWGHRCNAPPFVPSPLPFFSK